MKVHEQTVDLEQKQRVTSRSQKSTDHQKDKTEKRHASAFQLYGIGECKDTHQPGAFHLYGLEMGNIIPFRLYGIGTHKGEYPSSPFVLYGVG